MSCRGVISFLNPSQPLEEENDFEIGGHEEGVSGYPGFE